MNRADAYGAVELAAKDAAKALAKLSVACKGAGLNQAAWEMGERAIDADALAVKAGELKERMIR